MFFSRKLATGLAAVILVGGGCVAQEPESSSSVAPPVLSEQKEATVPPEKEQMAELPALQVGVLAPLSGDSFRDGESIRRAVQLAQKQFGLEKIAFVFEDSRCDTQKATDAMTKLVTKDSVVAVIGGVCLEDAAAAAEVAEENHVVMISPAVTASTLSDAGTFIFRTIPSDVSQAKFGANMMYQKGGRKLAILYTSDEYGIAFRETLEEAFPKAGGKVVASERVSPGLVSVKAQVAKIKAAQPDVLYIASKSAKTVAAVLQEKRNANLNIPVFGSEGAKSDEMIRHANGAAEDMTVSAVGKPSEPFVELYKKEVGLQPSMFAAQTYDAVQVLAVALRDGAKTGEEVRDALDSVSLAGVSGNIEFDQNGDISGTYDVFVVKKGVFEKE